MGGLSDPASPSHHLGVIRPVYQEAQMVYKRGMVQELDPTVQHQLKIETQARRKAMQAQLPGLAVRIFTLGGASYPGCGFHYDMVKSIGYLLNRINDYDRGLDHMAMVTLGIVYEDLLEQVIEAEAVAIPLNTLPTSPDGV